MTQEELQKIQCSNCRNYNSLTTTYGTCEEACMFIMDEHYMGSEEDDVNVLVGRYFGCIHWKERP